MMWSAGVLASVSSITYPAISAMVSMHADGDKQGLVQGMVTGIRGLCNGLGPAMYGVVFYLFHVDLNDDPSKPTPPPSNSTDINLDVSLISMINIIFCVQLLFQFITSLMPGPPFVFGAMLVILAILVAAFIPETDGSRGSFRDNDEDRRRKAVEDKRRSDDSYEDDSDPEYKMPLIHESDDEVDLS